MLLSDPTLPLRMTHAPLRLTAGERWCCKCGYDLTGREADYDEDGRDRRGKAAHCPRCHSKRLVPAVEVLLAGEFEMVQ